jgi:hypothetical protein
MKTVWNKIIRRFCRHDYRPLIIYDQYCTLFRCRKCEKLYYIDAENDHRETDETAISTIRSIHSSQMKIPESVLIKRTEFLTTVAKSPESIKEFAQELKRKFIEDEKSEKSKK